MEFCSACQNMMLVRSSTDGRTGEYRCPNCDNHRPITGATVLRVRKPADDSAEYARYLTPLLSTDPTLPRAPGLACPFCSVVDEVLFVKYNAAGMRYLYHCGGCKAFWKRARGQDPERLQAA